MTQVQILFKIKNPSLGLFQVVTDPHTADAIFTDRVGAAFESRLQDLLRPKDQSKKDDEEHVRINAMSRGQGNVFLVDAKSRAVLWSTYQRPRNFGPKEVNHVASEIAVQLEKALHPK